MDELPQGDKEKLEAILMKPPHELIQHEIDRLNARRDYLPYATKQAYKSVLIQDDTQAFDPNAEQEITTQQPQTQYTDPQNPETNQTEQIEQTQSEAPQDANPADTGNGQSTESNPYAADPNAA